MRSIDIVFKDLSRRKVRLLSGLLVVIIGIAAVVAVQTINDASQHKIASELDKFGPNILVQPKTESMGIYYGSIVIGNVEMPEAYVKRVLSIPDADRIKIISPKIYEAVNFAGVNFVIAGVLPENERAMKSWWKIEGDLPMEESPQLLLGHSLANQLGASKAFQITLKNTTFTVSGVLQETGSADDYMAFAPLHVVQKAFSKEGAINVIELQACCFAGKGMTIDDDAMEIVQMLPDVKAVTVTQIANSQTQTLAKTFEFGYLLSGLILIAGCAGMMNFVFSSVHEQRREIGVLLAVGAEKRQIYKLFMLRALVFGLVGGMTGYIIGSALSIVAGPLIADTAIQPLLILLPYSIALAVPICVISSIIPARSAAKLDPTEALQAI